MDEKLLNNNNCEYTYENITEINTNTNKKIYDEFNENKHEKSKMFVAFVILIIFCVLLIILIV